MADMRTPLGKVRGLGSAQEGTEHFWRQRLTAVANVPLILFFVGFLIALQRRRLRRGARGAVQSVRGAGPDAGRALGPLPHAARHAGHHRGLRARRGRQDRRCSCSTRSSRSRSAWLRLRPAQNRIRRLTQWQRHHWQRQQRQGLHLCRPQVRRGRRRRRRRRPARHARHGRAGPEDGLHHQGLPDPLAHGRGAGRHRRLAAATWARTAGSGTCTTPSRARTGSATSTPWNIWSREAPAAVYELEHYGVPFSRTEEGKIYQRPVRRPHAELSATARPCSAPAPPPTAPATPSCTRSMASR